MLLTGKKLRLRAVEAEDLPKLYEWENDTTLWQLGSNVAPYSNYTLQEYIKSASEDLFSAKQLRLIITIKATKESVGTIDLFDLDPRHRRCGVGILIDRAHQSKGYAKEALQLIKEYALNFLNLNQLYAHIPCSNSVSIKLFTNCGFEHTGTCKKWLLTSEGFEDVLFTQCYK